MRYDLLFLFLFCRFSAQAQPIEPVILSKPWRAYWITVPDESATGYGVYLFRKVIELPTKPATFVVHVSADNRYKLLVNSTLVSLGPSRGDLTHWKFETVDLAPYLQAGKNTIATQVWNEGEMRPEAQISLRTGFILQGNADAEQLLNTNSSWRCIRDSSYRPLPTRIPPMAYYVAGPGELMARKANLNGWETATYSDLGWKTARPLFSGTPKNGVGGTGVPNGWMLIPSGLPPMELSPQRFVQLRKAEGITVPASFPATKTALTIPANTVATLLLDQTVLTNAYPTLRFSRGKDGTISLGYAEALFTKFPSKGNRNEVEGKTFIGRKDSLISNGSEGQVFTPLNFRTYRYMQLRVTTKTEPLVIDDLYSTFTGYPFQRMAKLETDNSEMKNVLDIGWRTARLCAVETYMDCPYYEQLQYIGDARIQALVSLYTSGDDRLLRNALNQMDESRQPEGITLSRHPSYSPQYIPMFSLWYIGMLHDYWMYGKDSQFIKNKLPGTRQILNYFRVYQQADGSLKDTPNWLFTDWVTAKGWSLGIAPRGADGSSAVLDLQLLWAYQMAADLESKIGMKEYAIIYTQYADQLKNTLQTKYWSASRKLFADRPEKDVFSQHANALAILTGVSTGNEAATMGKQLLADSSLAPASIYFKYYLHQALVKAGLGNDYQNWLGKWRENVALGLTTWAETSDVNTSRSDCHAWGSSPNIEFFRTVLGIDSDAPGFAKVKITPHLGSINNIIGEIPHPNGMLSVNYKQDQHKLQTEINLPPKTTGIFIWKGKTYPLKAGINKLKI
ncbi:alpha-L-rhamnosidase-related protein [Spirosoma endophyticum]|uniref:Alpha-L-rhamnosidase n=1 Tax=Spirosoma endophyticum TaxID=662367 RepID=A0A1I2GU80_9BACT|nr:alpha-L-rhamnosidase C-terminal domain-containing protein [Spirosoma endophyticum]SFF20609.1 alpha-L-rhamnosidase [Spirosoma endophyticum]